MAHVRERPSLRESTEIVTPSGKRYRWSDDEANPENIPSGERWSDSMPGGYETKDATLPRKADVDYSDLERLSNWTRYDAAGGVIWDGRLERAPRVSGDQIAISPSAVGWQAHLEDDKSVREIYIDRDLGRWRDLGVARRIVLTAYALGSVGAAPNPSGSAALVLSYQGGWASANGFVVEGYYEAPSGVVIGDCYFTWATNTNIGTGGGDFSLLVGATDDEVAFFDYSADQLTGAASSGSVTYSPATKRKEVQLQLRYSSGPAGADGNAYEVYLTDVAVYGNHGLTKRGSSPDQGFYDGDIIGHALDTWCPLLNHTNESLTLAPFPIPQAAFLDPTTAGEIVRQATRFGLRDWAVWDNRTFWLHDRGAQGRRWRARVGPSGLEETGPQVDRLWESIIVAYQDVDGSTRTVGPVGSGADTETSELKDADSENPANKLGITRRDMLTMGTSTPAGATEVGARFLEQSKLLDSSGRAKVVGFVEDDRGIVHPYSHMRSGDYITFVDAADTGYRRIVHTDKSRDDRTCSFDLDAPPEGLQALLERLGVVLVPLGL